MAWVGLFDWIEAAYMRSAWRSGFITLLPFVLVDFLSVVGWINRTE